MALPALDEGGIVRLEPLELVGATLLAEVELALDVGVIDAFLEVSASFLGVRENSAMLMRC